MVHQLHEPLAPFLVGSLNEYRSDGMDAKGILVFALLREFPGSVRDAR
jgi:hypothetical protein